MSQPNYVINQPAPPQAPAPVSWTITEDASGNIYLNAASVSVNGGTPVAIFAIARQDPAGATGLREAINSAMAAAFGLQIDTSNKLVIS